MIRRAVALPWPAKLALRIAFDHLPITYDQWRAWGLFRHGAMTDPGYARAVWAHHWARSQLDSRGFAVLELGPGDSALTVLCARAAGAEQVWLVDRHPAAARELGPYQQLADQLRAEGADIPDLTGISGLDDLLARCGATYLTGGPEVLDAIPTGSIQFSLSQAALEHVHRDDVDGLLRSLRRVHAPQSITSHRIDLQDHLNGSLNHLRVRTSWWESRPVHASAIYTNRLRRAQWMAAFARAGFHPSDLGGERWPRPPVKPTLMVDPYRTMDDDELRVAAFDLVGVAGPIPSSLG